jgi:2-polyprenyl-6-methoxyphenol hydroxylase and related FAD-dependent oxidoreductases
MDAYDVAVVGGGPVGMWLAAELHRGGVRPVVLERRAERPPYSKALTIYPRTVEQFAMRGLVDRWLAEGTPVPSSHFALLTNRLDFSFLPTRYPFTLFLPQRRTEELLEEHLAELGVPYLRQHAVTGLGRTSPASTWTSTHPAGPPSSAPPTRWAAMAPRACSAPRPGSNSKGPRTPGGRSSATSS